MDISYHITFADGRNPYYSSSTDEKKQVKAINKLMVSNFNNRCDILVDGYRISNTAWGTWVVYKQGKWIDEILSKQYRKLGNAVKYLEKIMEK
nr:MAG TPA: protein of unknown function DUF4041 [Caudoviricetes sp.]